MPRFYANADGAVLTTQAPSPIPSTAYRRGGLAFTPDGALYTVGGFGISAEGYGASPSASAAVNAAAIQAALTAANAAGGGTVTLTTAGTYLINATLVMYSNTRFVGSPNVIIKQADSTNLAQFVTESYSTRATTTTVTITWSSGITASVAWTGHGLSAGDYVWVQGAAQGVYNQVFLVGTVTDANNFVVALPYLPTTAATGTIVAKKCTANFSIGGGFTVDHNYINNTGATGLDRMCVVLGIAANFSVDGIRTTNIDKYGILVGGVADYQIQNMYADGPQGASSSESIKTYGPARNGFIHNVYAVTTDDGMSIQPKEADGFSVYRFTFGDVFNLHVDTVHLQSGAGGQALGIYCSDNELCDNITLENVDAIGTAASSHNGIALKYGNAFSTGTLGRITINNVRPRENSSTNFAINASCNIRQLTIQGATYLPTTLAAQNLFRNTAGTIQQLNFDGLVIDNTSWPNTPLYLINISSTVSQLNIRNVLFNGNATNGRLLSVGASVDQITIDSLNMTSGGMICVIQASLAITTAMTIRNSRVKSIATGVQVNSACQINLEGNVFDTVSQSVIRGNAAVACIVRSSGDNRFVSAPFFTNGSTTTLDVYGFDLTVDVGATGVNRTAGTHCFFVGTRGTLVTNNAVICDATGAANSWKQISNTGNAF